MPAPLPAGSTTIRVRYCECDPMGVAHHASFPPWFEVARTELLRDNARSYAAAEAEGVFLVVTRLDVRYRRPVRYDDLLTVHARVTGATRVKILHDYEVRLQHREGADLTAMAHAGEDLLATASTTLACVDADGRPRPIPGWILAGH